MEIRVLVDDDAVFRELVCDILRKQGCSPLEAADGEQAIDRFFEERGIALVVLDVMMPRYDGWEVLRRIREHSAVPVVMLTALGDERHEVLGLRQGADDYIAKPFSHEVFVARIDALLRRIRKERLEPVETGGLRIEPASRRVFADGREAVLNRKEFDLLSFLLANRNRTLTREQILADVWGYGFEGEIRTIDTHIKTLRAKLGAQGSRIRTLRGVGYLFEEATP